jgi:hypothetical protein
MFEFVLYMVLSSSDGGLQFKTATIKAPTEQIAEETCHQLRDEFITLDTKVRYGQKSAKCIKIGKSLTIDIN